MTIASHSSLPPEYQEALNLRSEGYSHESIARALDVSHDTVRRMLSAAMKHLRGEVDLNASKAVHPSHEYNKLSAWERANPQPCPRCYLRIVKDQDDHVCLPDRADAMLRNNGGNEL